MKSNEQAYRGLMRRVLVPLLVVAVPVAAMIAFVLYQKKSQTAQSSESVSKPEISFGAESWPFFRGNPGLSGVAPGQMPNTLKKAWEFQTGDQITSSAVVAENTVFITSMDGFLYALDLKSGKERWRYKADDDIEASAVYYEKTVFFGDSSGVFYAVDSETGKPRWQTKPGAKITGAANIVSLPGKLPMVVFGSYDNNLYGYDVRSGEQVFIQEADNYINGSVAVSGGIVSFGSCDACVYLVPVESPEKVTRIDTGSYVAANPAIDNGVVFAGNYEGTFIAAEVATGKELWRFEETQDAFFSSPAVNSQYVVVGCRDEKLYCFDRQDGHVVWTFTGGDSFDSSPVICGETVIVGNDDGRIYLVNLEKGTEIFSYTLGKAIISSAAVVQNYVLIGCDNGILYAFDTK